MIYYIAWATLFDTFPEVRLSNFRTLSILMLCQGIPCFPAKKGLDSELWKTLWLRWSVHDHDGRRCTRFAKHHKVFHLPVSSCSRLGNKKGVSEPIWTTDNNLSNLRLYGRCDACVKQVRTDNLEDEWYRWTFDEWQVRTELKLFYCFT